MELGLNLGISNEEYHADRTCVSSTWLKIIDYNSPYHLRSYLDSPPAPRTPALVMGAAVDCLIFEPEVWDRQFIVPPEINRRTNVGKEEWAELEKTAKAEYKHIIKLEDYEEALATAASVRRNPRMVDILSRGVPQPVFVWVDPVTGLKCKCKLDWYDQETGTLYDLKTALDASPVGFSKAVANNGYHIQEAFYGDGVRCSGFPAKRFIFCVQEKPDGKNTFVADPKLMAFYELDETDVEAGRDSYSSALSAIDFCVANNEWPGYTNDIVPLTRPNWARSSDMSKVAAL